MKNVQSFNEFVNESVVNENIRRDMPKYEEALKAAASDFPAKNKRSQLQKLAKRTKGSETFDQDTKFTYSPDGQIFAVYKYSDQGAVDNFLYKGKGDGDKAKENLDLFRVYLETGRPGYRVYLDGTQAKKEKIGKDGRTKY
jgi:hypothetical protein